MRVQILSQSCATIHHNTLFTDIYNVINTQAILTLELQRGNRTLTLKPAYNSRPETLGFA